MKKIIIFMTVILAAIDQVIKYFITTNLEIYKSIKVIPNFLYLTYVKNDGAAFSILSGSRYFLIAVAVLVLIILIRFIIMDKKINKFDIISYSLILSGIIGNLIDRILTGKVIDYIDVYLFNYNAPVFNFADMCIVIGTIMVLYSLIVKGDNNEDIDSRRRS